jgi:hypothetical protein
VGKGGGLVVGGPPDVDEQYRELRRSIERLAGRLPLRKAVAGLGVLLALGMGWHYLFGPAERLDLVAEEAARALAVNDREALESLAAPGTAEEVRRWYDAVHPRLAQLRERWGGKAEVVEAHVAREDRDRGEGSAGVAIKPAISGARDVSLANPGEATAAAAFEEAMEWTLARWGRWKLDGRATYARLPPPPPPPVSSPGRSTSVPSGGRSRR